MGKSFLAVLRAKIHGFRITAAGMACLALLPAAVQRSFSSEISEKSEEVAPEEPDATPPAPNIARLGRVPDWSLLDPYQETMSRAEFVYLLRHCYVRNDDDFAEHILIEHDRVRIVKQSNYPEGGYYELHFKDERGIPETKSRYWRKVTEIDALPGNSARPLQDIVIAIDPGHIGGPWVTWDDRHFQIGKDTLEVREGEMALRVAKILEKDLTRLGARVVLTRHANEPVTPLRPEDLRDEARTYLVRKNIVPSAGLIESTSKKMFAISSDIRSRADLLNDELQPDLALCLHFDASPWGSRPSFRDRNHLHLMVNGCYAEFEVAEDDTRLEMLLRLLQRIYYQELDLANALSRTMQDETRLPAFSYDGTNGKSVNDNPYVWARNLLANRSFICPVVFFEPFCMNHRETYDRVQAGEYRGLREFNGIYRKNIYQEYADGVTSGLVNYFRNNR